jgi:hypothetical protein
VAGGLFALSGTINADPETTALLAYLLLWGPVWLAIGVGYLMLALSVSRLEIKAPVRRHSGEESAKFRP